MPPPHPGPHGILTAVAGSRNVLFLVFSCFFFPRVPSLDFFYFGFLFEEWKLCFVCVCCSSGLPCPSCSSLRNPLPTPACCRCRSIFIFFKIFFYCISPAVLFTLAQSTVAVVGSCFSCAYLYICRTTDAGRGAGRAWRGREDQQRLYFFLARNLYLCICLLVYCAAARQLCLLYLRSIEAGNSILKSPPAGG